MCSRQCNTLITLCLDTYESSDDFNVCPFGARNLSAINDKSSIEFTTPTAGDVENPVLRPFSNNYRVSLIRNCFQIQKSYLNILIFKSNGYRLKIGILNELTSQLNPIDFIRIDFKIEKPFQLATSKYISLMAKGNRSLAEPTRYDHACAFCFVPLQV